MKKLISSLMMLAFACSAMAASQAELDQRILKLTSKFEAMQAKPDKAIPAKILKNAQGIVLLDRTKAGFIIGFQGGGGVAMVRDSVTKEWSAPAFYNANEGSIGFQVGGQQTFMVMVLMNTNAVRALIDHNGEFGGAAEGTAGDSSTNAGESVHEDDQAILIYSDTKGLYGGATIKGGAVSPNEKDNMRYYGEYVWVQDILFKKKVEPTATAKALAAKIESYAQPTPELSQK
ncbi:MAG TPA: lipid-binding SYLF domain-containing protein [Verrucomicrobiae bacterium]